MADLVFRKSASDITRESIDDLASKTNLSFPESYKNFLIRQNGGLPNHRVFNIHWQGQPWLEQWPASLISWFYAIDPDSKLDLEKMIRLMRPWLPESVFPFARDVFGNDLCLGWTGDVLGKVFFFLDLKDSETPNPSWGRAGFVASSLQEFFDGLYSE